ncbi:MAG: hypothetical protein K8F91_06395 [Candidatus Obscuribacterales bacterium]|nr:hypothetical protein [Candidatus Obscuribacterales bacterium]
MKTAKRGCPAIRVVMFPKDTNGAGNIFGGVILSHIDVAGAVAASDICSHRLVTVSFKEAEFKKPVHVKDILTCWAEVTDIGASSITTKVWVEVKRKGEMIPVTQAEVVYVAVDENHRPIPIATGLISRKWKKVLRDREAGKAGSATKASTGEPSACCSPGKRKS